MGASLGASKAECIDPPVSADVEMVLRCYQCLEVMKASQRVAAFVLAEDWFAGIAPESMKSVVALCAEDPHDRI